MDLVTCAIAASVAIDDGDEAAVVSVLRELAALRRLVDAAEITCLLRLDDLAAADPGLSPEHLVAAATRRSVAAATTAGERARERWPCLRSGTGSRTERSPASTSTPSRVRCAASNRSIATSCCSVRRPSLPRRSP